MSSAVYCQAPHIVMCRILSSAVYSQAPYIVKRRILPSAVYCRAVYIVKRRTLSGCVYCQAAYIVKWRILSSGVYCRGAYIVKHRILLHDRPELLFLSCYSIIFALGKKVLEYSGKCSFSKWPVTFCFLAQHLPIKVKVLHCFA